MITPELIARINELSRKKRAGGLSKSEAAEQQELRRIYLEGIREQMTRLLDSIEYAEAGEDALGFGREVDLSHRIMDFQAEMHRPFVDNEHIH